MRESLISDTGLEKPPQMETNIYIEQYNTAIFQYNEKRNINYPCLRLIGNSSILHLKITKILQQFKWMFLLAIVMLAIPVVNGILLGVLIWHVCKIYNHWKIHRGNVKTFPDLLEKCRHDSELCKQMGKHFTSIRLSVPCKSNIK